MLFYRKYRFSQSASIILTVCLLLFSKIALWLSLHWLNALGIAMIILGAALEIPLLYLQAMRQLYLKLQKERDNQQGCTTVSSEGAPSKEP